MLFRVPPGTEIHVDTTWSETCCSDLQNTSPIQQKLIMTYVKIIKSESCSLGEHRDGRAANVHSDHIIARYILYCAAHTVLRHLKSNRVFEYGNKFTSICHHHFLLPNQTLILHLHSFASLPPIASTCLMCFFVKRSANAIASILLATCKLPLEALLHNTLVIPCTVF